MADYSVHLYKVARRTGNDGVERVYLDVTLADSVGNNINASYWMTDDERASIAGIESALLQGLSYAVNKSSKISIDVDQQRAYLRFTLPSANGEQKFQFTGEQI